MNIVLLIGRQGQFFYEGCRQLCPFFSMTNSAPGAVLMAAGDIMQVGGHQQYVHIRPFGISNAFTQPADPECMVPVMTAPGTLKISEGHSFCGIEHAC